MNMGTEPIRDPEMNGVGDDKSDHPSEDHEMCNGNAAEMVELDLNHNGEVGKKHAKKIKKKKGASRRCLLSDDQCGSNGFHGGCEDSSIEIPSSGPVKEAPRSPKSKDTEEKKVLDMLKAITDSYRTIQSKLDNVGDTVKSSAHIGVNYVQNNSRNFERLFIALLLIPAFVMATLAVYRQENHTYTFDLGESESAKMYRIAQANFDAWNEALLSQNKERISALYSVDLSFLPTMSDAFVVSTRSEDNYFMHFLEKQPAGVIVEDKVQALGTDAYLHSGLYDFLLMSGATDGVFTTVHARFTYLWRNFDGVWKIMHHHSSQMPSAFNCGKSATNSSGSGH